MLLINRNNQLVQTVKAILCFLSLMLCSVAYAEVTLTKVEFNTLLQNEVEVVFSFDGSLSSKPDIQLKTDPAQVELVFDYQRSYDQSGIFTGTAFGCIHCLVIGLCQVIPWDYLTPFHPPVVCLQLSAKRKNKT